MSAREPDQVAADAFPPRLAQSTLWSFATWVTLTCFCALPPFILAAVFGGVQFVAGMLAGVLAWICVMTVVDVALRRRGFETAVRILIVGAIAWAIVDVIVTALGFGYTMWITSVSFVAELLPEPRGDFGCGALWSVIGGCLSAVMVSFLGGMAWAVGRGTHSRQRVGPSMRA